MYPTCVSSKLCEFFVIVIIKITIIIIIGPSLSQLAFFLSYAQNVVFDIRKKVARNDGRRWGEVTMTKPERKRSFFGVVVPNIGTFESYSKQIHELVKVHVRFKQCSGPEPKS